MNEHLPQIDAVQQLRNAHASLETSASDYHITTTTTSKGVQISLAPKDPSLTEKLSFKLHLDSSPEGEALKKRLTEFIHAGGSLSIPKAQLQDLVLPKSMEIFGISASSLSDKIEFQQAPREIGEFSLRRICEDGQRASIEHLPLLNIQSGTSRMKLAYNGNNRALELELIVDIISKEATLTFTPKTFGHNAKEVFDAINFAVALSKDGVVEVVQSSTGIVALSAKGTFQPMPQSQELLNLFMRLATIQLKTQTPIVLKQELTLAEHDAITEAYLAVTVGNVPIPTFTGNGTPDQKLSEDRREQMSGRFVTRSPSDYAVTIGQKAINLGPWEIVADNATVVWNEERTKFKIEPIGDSLSYINFPRFSGSSEIKEPDQSGTA